MIGRLTGILAEKQPPLLLLEVQGVGYEVQAPMTTFYRLPDLGGEVTLHTHFSVSENLQQLFGFADKRDRQLFRALIKVNGVGPKLALGILSGMEADDFVRCVSEDNTAALVRVPGVGKKTAERLVVEMRDRIKDWNAAASPVGEVVVENTPVAGFGRESDRVAEAESALVALGYKPAEAAKLVANILKKQDNGTETLRSEDMIRLALRSALP